MVKIIKTVVNEILKNDIDCYTKYVNNFVQNR